MPFGRYAKNDPEVPCPVVNGWCQVNEDGNVKPVVEILHKNSPRTEVVLEILLLHGIVLQTIWFVLIYMCHDRSCNDEKDDLEVETPH